MCKIPFGGWIANAAARLSGARGSVTTQAQQANCSRQTVYDHAQKVEAAVETEHGGGATHEQKDREIAALRRENGQLWAWLVLTIEFPLAKQQMFAAKGMGMGLSHSQVHDLLAFLLGARACPSRSTIHRWVQAAARAAGAVLKRLDRGCRVLVMVGCLDEIFFHRRPVLVGIDPQSMVWFLGKKAANHQGSTWFGELQPWTSLRYVTCDAGKGLQSGIAQMQQHQRQTNQVPLEKGLDVFHTKKEAHRALSVLWNRVERLWELAEKASRARDRAERQGRHLSGLTSLANKAWKKATLAFQLYEKREAAWKRVEPALDLFGADGRLQRSDLKRKSKFAGVGFHSPAAGQGMVQGPWAPDGAAESAHSRSWIGCTISWVNWSVLAAVRDALVRLWWLRRQRPKKSSESAPCRVVNTYCIYYRWCSVRNSTRTGVSRTGWSLWCWVRRRASQARWECMNSVLRMHQSRHRTVTQGMLDLKRLYLKLSGVPWWEAERPLSCMSIWA